MSAQEKRVPYLRAFQHFDRHPDFKEPVKRWRLRITEAHVVNRSGERELRALNLFRFRNPSPRSVRGLPKALVSVSISPKESQL